MEHIRALNVDVNPIIGWPVPAETQQHREIFRGVMLEPVPRHGVSQGDGSEPRTNFIGD